MVHRLDPTIEALLRAARAEYAASLPGKVDLLEELADAESWRDVRRAAHRLRGSASTYAFERLGAIASDLEEMLIEAGDEPSAASRERVARKLRDCRLEIERVLAEPT